MFYISITLINKQLASDIHGFKHVKKECKSTERAIWKCEKSSVNQEDFSLFYNKIDSNSDIWISWHIFITFSSHWFQYGIHQLRI